MCGVCVCMCVCVQGDAAPDPRSSAHLDSVDRFIVDLALRTCVHVHSLCVDSHPPCYAFSLCRSGHRLTDLALLELDSVSSPRGNQLPRPVSPTRDTRCQMSSVPSAVRRHCGCRGPLADSEPCRGPRVQSWTQGPSHGPRVISWTQDLLMVLLCTQSPLAAPEPSGVQGACNSDPRYKFPSEFCTNGVFDPCGLSFSKWKWAHPRG